MLSRTLLTTLALSTLAFAETVKDREGAVRNDKATLEKDKRWLYNDVAQGFAEAKRTGKPLLVVLRCVPCLACMGIDSKVLLQESELAPLLDQFVCLRVINANALELSKFQFDYDLSFSTMFFNADGTTYGRFGSWLHQKNAQEQATAGLRQALVGALALHKGYPANRASLTGKQSAPMPFKTPVDIPTLNGKYKADLDWNGKVVQSCVHCHQIGDAMRLTYRDKGEPIPTEWIFPFPAPETIGLTLAGDQAAKVESVEPASIAASAGIKPGDELTAIAGQPLISIADTSWALHRAPAQGPLDITVKRGAATSTVQLILPAEWRRKSDISRRVGTWPMRGMASGGLVMEDLDDAARTKRGIDPKALALYVKNVGQHGKHAAAKNAGSQKEDVVVDCDGLLARMTEGELIAHLLQKHRAGDKVPVTVLRGGKRVSLTLPIQ